MKQKQASNRHRIVDQDERQHRQRLKELHNLRPLLPTRVSRSNILNALKEPELSRLLYRLLDIAKDPRRAAAVALHRKIDLWSSTIPHRFEQLFIEDEHVGSYHATWLLTETGGRIYPPLNESGYLPSVHITLDASLEQVIRRTTTAIRNLAKANPMLYHRIIARGTRPKGRPTGTSTPKRPKKHDEREALRSFASWASGYLKNHGQRDLWKPPAQADCYWYGDKSHRDHRCAILRDLARRRDRSRTFRRILEVYRPPSL